ncbi:MAG: hypothetical protein JWQ55_6161 [Rhodopila sp.]|jgi:hypothetical protein|nr:hypothetical protein [Rhodopila sp.]
MFVNLAVKARDAVPEGGDTALPANTGAAGRSCPPCADQLC